MLEEEQSLFINKLLQRLGNEDWGKWLKEEKQSMDSSKIASDDVFYNILLKKIEHEMDILKQQ